MKAEGPVAVVFPSGSEDAITLQGLRLSKLCIS